MTAISSRPVSPSPIMPAATTSTHAGAADTVMDQAIKIFKEVYLQEGGSKHVAKEKEKAEAFLCTQGISRSSSEFQTFSKSVQDITHNHVLELAKKMIDDPVPPGTTAEQRVHKATCLLLQHSISKGHPIAVAFYDYADSQGKTTPYLNEALKPDRSPEPGRNAIMAHIGRNPTVNSSKTERRSTEAPHVPSLPPPTMKFGNQWSANITVNSSKTERPSTEAPHVPSLPPPKMKFGSKWSANMPDPARTLSPEIPAAWNLTLAMMGKVDLPRGSNHAFMPGSILQQAVYLAMLSAGEGRAELFRLLGLKNGDINAQLDLIARNTALSVDDLSHIFGTGSSLWIHDTDAGNAKSTLPLFKCQDQMRELGLHMDVADLRKSPEVVNQWANEKTGGKISTLLDASELSNADFALTSFNQFKAKWKTAFEPATEPLMFTNSLGKVKAVDGMQHQRISIPAFEGPNFQCFALPYDAGGLDVRAAVFLPHKGTPVDELYRQLSSGTDGGASNSLPAHLAQLGRIQETSCRVTMPAFLSESQTDVRNTLCNLEADALFNPRKTNFSPIFGEGNRPHVELAVMKDKTAIKFDREGTEAVSAAASVGSARSSIPVLKVDRPFMVVIYTAFGADDIKDKLFPWPLAVTMVNDPGSSK
ncbi:serpin family protein [Noviherbaspirillum aerium]|uniref:serpin family protein n=1 Tax=Noviherbaspirillum aerium TaxID=2588497 RepID=UPI00124D8280|nr:serpin family protein [Noviherbaspirillum aerium]